MFLDLATETGKGDWSVIRGFILLSFFEDRCDVSYPPVRGTVPVLKLSWKIIVRKWVISMASSFSGAYNNRNGPERTGMDRNAPEWASITGMDIRINLFYATKFIILP